MGSAAKRLGVQHGGRGARWGGRARRKVGGRKRASLRLPLLYGKRFILYFRFVNVENGEIGEIYVINIVVVISFLAGVSSVSSSSSSSASSTASSNLGKPTRVRQPSGATLRRSQTQSMKMRIQVRWMRSYGNSISEILLKWLISCLIVSDQEYQDPVQQVAEEEEVMRENRRLPPIKEFQRDYRAGKASTRIRW